MLLVLSTWPDLETARAMARRLVEEKLAACVNILPTVESIYAWEGKTETAAEVLCLLKTTREKYPALEQRLQELHPYDVPEIIGLPLEAGAPAYLRWVAQCCAAPPADPTMPS